MFLKLRLQILKNICLVLETASQIVLQQLASLFKPPQTEPIFSNFRSSHWKFSVWKGVLRNFENFTGKHLCWSRNKASGLEGCKFFKRCFPVKFAKFLKSPILSCQTTASVNLVTLYLKRVALVLFRKIL